MPFLVECDAITLSSLNISLFISITLLIFLQPRSGTQIFSCKLSEASFLYASPGDMKNERAEFKSIFRKEKAPEAIDNMVTP
jgi:hypothetical protein